MVAGAYPTQPIQYVAVTRLANAVPQDMCGPLSRGHDLMARHGEHHSYLRHLQDA